MAVTNNVVFVLVDNKQQVTESIEIKALKYDLSQKDIEITNLNNNITTLNNTVSELKSEFKRVIPDLSEFDKFKLTPEYPKFKKEFLEAFVRFHHWGSCNGKDNGSTHYQNLIKIRKEYKILDELKIEIDLMVSSKNPWSGSSFCEYTQYVYERIGKKFDIDYKEFYYSVKER